MYDKEDGRLVVALVKLCHEDCLRSEKKCRVKIAYGFHRLFDRPLPNELAFSDDSVSCSFIRKRKK
jgi:hypothetical protein